MRFVMFTCVLVLDTSRMALGDGPPTLYPKLASSLQVRAKSKSMYRLTYLHKQNYQMGCSCEKYDMYN